MHSQVPPNSNRSRTHPSKKKIICSCLMKIWSSFWLQWNHVGVLVGGVPHKSWDFLKILALVCPAPQLSPLWSCINCSSFARGYPNARWGIGWGKGGVSHCIRIFLPHQRMLTGGILFADPLLILGTWLWISAVCDITRMKQTPEMQWCFYRVEGRLTPCPSAEGARCPLHPILGW